MVGSHGGITLATLRDVNLDKRCVALPRYIVYVYIYICLLSEKTVSKIWTFIHLSDSMQINIRTTTNIILKIISEKTNQYRS